MSTTRILPAAATVILSSLLILLFLSFSSAQQDSEPHIAAHQRIPFGGRGSLKNYTRYIPNRFGRHKRHRIRVARQFLNAHNSIRALKGLPPLRWDSKVAHYARHWGAQRMVDCEMIHSNGQYGENLFWGGRDHWTPTEVVLSWAQEQEDFNPISNACSEGKMCGHYTQLVWRSTTKVGCARQKCTGGGMIAICNYDPPGNYINENPFTTSPATADQSNQ